jgi:hypothetical protein
VGTQNIVVGRSASIAAVTAAGSNPRRWSSLSRPTTRPPASRVPIAKRSGAEW